MYISTTLAGRSPTRFSRTLRSRHESLSVVKSHSTTRQNHLRALEIWRYAEDSARFIFGDDLGDPIADEILRSLRASPEGLTRTQIRDRFNRHASGGVGRALNSLHALKKAKLPLIPTNRLVQQQSYFKFWKWARDWLAEETALERGLEADFVAKIYIEVLYAQSWAFVMFLYEHEGGKYRARILKYTNASLRAFRLMEGKAGYVTPFGAFERIFELKSEDDWKRFDNEFRAYVDGLLRKYPATD